MRRYYIWKQVYLCQSKNHLIESLPGFFFLNKLTTHNTKMPKSTKTQQDQCCDEVTEELLTMRQTVEKMFYKLTKQIIELRREVTDSMSNTTSEGTPASEKACSPDPSEPPTKMAKVRRDNSDESDSKSVKLEMNKNVKKSKNVPDNTDSEPNESNRITQINRMERPLLKLHNIQARVLPTQPFESAEQFEGWHDILKQDKELCDKLKVELLQEYPVEPDKYINIIWRSIFKNEAANYYTYWAKGFSKRRAIKNYLITNIFQECFQQRFRGLDDFFVERTMRFFHAAHDQLRRSLRNGKKSRSEPRVQNETLTEDEIEIPDDYEDSIF